MLCSISKIEIPIPYSRKRVDIRLDGRSLIITGGNGCGKTSFITAIYNHLKNGIDDPKNNNQVELTQQINWYQTQLDNIGRDGGNYDSFTNSLKKLQARKNELSKFKIEVNSIDNKEIRSLLRFHSATRQSAILSPSQAPKHSVLVEENKHFANDKDGSQFFESYLLSLKKNQSYAIAFDKNETEANRIKKWFDKIQTDLRLLFEDSNLILEFDTKDEKFYLHQDEKDRYTFQTLSAGYSSILSIYTDLIMRVEMWGVSPDNIQGVIFIDEIDAHLHVSLQKQILRFFIKSFPKIQFIVTTHSPFVVTSVSSTIIYDLTTNEQIIDVSSYSYGVVMEEIFGVIPESHVLMDKITHIESLTNNITPENIDELEAMISSLASDQENMSNDTQAFLDAARLKLIKTKKTIEK
ncbi:AAA family ATPase [Yersinia enterocolitica]|uniref:AAA family ATPase n=1 Tax=Yersinia TaxID=629 RepID=UPI001A9E48A7|nr:AAA family ATPase [Yersinia pseudotuberculosis]EKN3564702.1 AAA family ATPase [Yersinia enterocolitica]EKN4887382.1 AAA family ATPase [Yersinia enterocolitica]EKN4888753.1 AAA family ATPase [Yersinia enterocolitica]EKN4901222.1 AAA family ATPase [Yersinia enterocolitica]MBO1555653.1 AAA family ATPase [Yersinia pseudotuberculosis]